MHCCARGGTENNIMLLKDENLHKKKEYVCYSHLLIFRVSALNSTPNFITSRPSAW